MGVEDLPNDLTPFITRTTQDHINGGGFGDVWKCNYNADDISAVVAVKAFRYPEQYYDSEKINKKINREIGILMILSHDNIVPLLGTATGFGRKPELLSLVTPWIPNGTLNVYLASKHNELTMLDRSRMLKDVSAGLRYLHSVPVVHGDITGANILIDEGGQAKLIDFGLSTVVLPLLGQLHLAATSIHAGAIPYAAPELLTNDIGDLPLEKTKTDIYSFGCVMLQILSGRHPWSEITQNLELRVYGLICQGRSPQRPAGHPAIMDSDWDIIQKCLQFKFELRPSADEVFDLVMRRVFSSDSSSPPNGPPDDASSNTDPWPSLHSLSTGSVTPFSTDSFRSTGSLGHEKRRSVPPPPLPPSASSSNHEMRPRQRNVVIFGETGSGKSSIINTIAQEQLAKTSNDAHGCTSTAQRYTVEISGQRFVLIDTAGLNLGAADTVPAGKAEKQLKSLLRELMNSRLDGISLLVYCMCSTIAPHVLVKAYNKFYSEICRKKVPIVVIVTGLEKETRMESWWDTNREKFEGMNFADHACVTALREHPSFPDNLTRCIAESGDIMRKLVLNNFVDLAVDNGSDLAVDKRGCSNVQVPRPLRIPASLSHSSMLRLRHIRVLAQCKVQNQMSYPTLVLRHASVSPESPLTATMLICSALASLSHHAAPYTCAISDPCVEITLVEVILAFWNPALAGVHGPLQEFRCSPGTCATWGEQSLI